ncbi:MAG: disulfide bond formation protein B [Minisyncoccia bacterium]
MNPVTIHYLNVVLGLGTIALQVFSVLALLILFFRPSGNKKNAYLDFIEKHFLILSFAISVFSALFPLVYSEIIGFLPCALCWWQRVFMFPAMFLFAIALWNKEKSVVRYAAPLLSVGFLISVYHNFFYYFGDSAGLPCDASGISCYQRLVSEFGGYISIPMMALTSFFALLTLLAVAHFYKKEV